MVGLALAAEPVAPVSPPVPSAYLARLAAARIPAECRGRGRQAARRRRARLVGQREQADESGQHHEARHHLLGAALVRPGVHVPHRGAVRGAAASAKCCAAICTCAAAATRKLVVEDLWLLVSRLRGFGIREIRGDVVLDKTLLRTAARTIRRSSMARKAAPTTSGPTRCW